MLVDLDNTLLDRAAAYRQWAEDLVADHPGSGDPVAEVDWLIEADGDGFIAREVAARTIADRYGLDADELLPTLRAGLVERMRLNPATGDALRRLRADGSAVVVVTNGTVPQQERKLRATGLAGLVDGWVISEGVGHRKPDGEIFDAAAGLVGRKLTGWMIGDSAEADIVGGQRAGLATAWLHRGRAWPRTDLSPTVIVDSCAAAIDHILGAAPGH